MAKAPAERRVRPSPASHKNIVLSPSSRIAILRRGHYCGVGASARINFPCFTPPRSRRESCGGRRQGALIDLSGRDRARNDGRDDRMPSGKCSAAAANGMFQRSATASIFVTRSSAPPVSLARNYRWRRIPTPVARIPEL